jgi:hypothetical protein
VDGEGGDGAVGGRGDAELRAGTRSPAAKTLRTVVWYASSTVTWPSASRSQPSCAARSSAGVLPDRVVDLLAAERGAVGEAQRAERALAQRQVGDRRLDERHVVLLELAAQVVVEVGRLAVRADDDVLRPGEEVERHPHRLAARAEDDGLLVARAVAVAVGADVARSPYTCSSPSTRGHTSLSPMARRRPARDEGARALARHVVVGRARPPGPEASTLAFVSSIGS